MTRTGKAIRSAAACPHWLVNLWHSAYCSLVCVVSTYSTLRTCHALSRPCRTLYQANGQFVTDNLNDWQHSTMCEWGGQRGSFTRGGAPHT